MIVAHYIPKNFSDLMGERFLPRVGVPAKAGIARHPVSDSEEDISGRFELTDAAGVEKQVLSPHWPPTCRASPAKKFWYDTVCYGSKAAFTCALEAFGADHLVTGSDYPVLQDYETYNRITRPTKRPSPVSSGWHCRGPMSKRSSTTTQRRCSAFGISA